MAYIRCIIYDSYAQSAVGRLNTLARQSGLGYRVDARIAVWILWIPYGANSGFQWGLTGKLLFDIKPANSLPPSHLIKRARMLRTRSIKLYHMNRICDRILSIYHPLHERRSAWPAEDQNKT